MLEFGGYILLKPELINAYAVLLRESCEPSRMSWGAFEEARLLSGEFMPHEHRIERDDETVVLQAMLGAFLSRGLCLLDVSAGNLLIFPAFFGRKRPESGEFPRAFVTYRFAGGSTNCTPRSSFGFTTPTCSSRTSCTRMRPISACATAQWFAAQGIKLTRLPESRGEITVYVDREIPDGIKVVFMGHIHNHLHVAGRAEGVVRTRDDDCPVCDRHFEGHEAIRRRLAEGKLDVGCPDCEERIPRDAIEEAFESRATEQECRIGT